jgi:cytochrome P450
MEIEMTEMADVAPLPTVRTTAFDPPAELRKRQPISPLRFMDGHIGWLVTNHAMARELLADQRFSSRNELRHRTVGRSILSAGVNHSLTRGAFVDMDPPGHTRFRRLLTGQFTVRRMKQLEPRIEAIVEERLEAMLRAGPPADLVRSFALPIPSLVICELLGVPYAERSRFQHDTATLLRTNVTAEESDAARKSIVDFLAELLARKRIEPDDAIISELIATCELTDEEIVGASYLLLIAGHETTANMLALGTFALLSHPDQLAALREDPSLVDGAVEELLRYLTIVQFGTVRGALEDVELHGQRIKAGESVCISLPAANRDPAKFADPDTLDVSRSTSGHLAFGYGIHQCLGQQLARIEMRIGYAALLRRLPALKLAIEPKDVRMCNDMMVYGVHELPIAW